MWYFANKLPSLTAYFKVYSYWFIVLVQFDTFYLHNRMIDISIFSMLNLRVLLNVFILKITLIFWRLCFVRLFSLILYFLITELKKLWIGKMLSQFFFLPIMISKWSCYKVLLMTLGWLLNNLLQMWKYSRALKVNIMGSQLVAAGDEIGGSVRATLC